MLSPNRVLFMAATLFAFVFVSGPAWAQSGCVCAECGRACNQIQTQGHRPGCSSYVAPKSAPGHNGSGYGAGGHRGGYNPQAMMMQSIMAPLFSAMFAPSPSGPSPAERAAAEQQRAEAEKQRQAAEKAKNEALQKWAKAQSDEEIRKQVEQQEKLKQGEKVLSQMQSAGGGGKLEPFSFGNPKLELQPIEQSGLPTAHLSEFEKLMCSSFFANMGKQASSPVDAKFYADQAERTMSGQPTYIECRAPKASNSAMAARTKAVKKVYEEAALKIQELDKIEPKLSEANEKLAAATTRKDEAAAKVKELETRTAETPPEQKDEVDDLVARAQQELQDAEKEAGDAQKTQQNLLEKKSRIESDLNNMKSKMQAGLQSE